MLHVFRPPAMLCLSVLLAGCNMSLGGIVNLNPHRIEIQQGNFIAQEAVSKLLPGMTKDQVRFVLGTPLVADLFHAERWDYVFRRLKTNSHVLEQQRLTVFFEDGKLARVEGDVVSPAPVPAPGSAPPPAPTPGKTGAGEEPASMK